MLTSFSAILELCISMVTALLGLAYPLFVDKINGIATMYKSKRMSARFRSDPAYIVFNIFLFVSILELFVFPFVIYAIHSKQIEMILLIVQGITVFILSLCMVLLYDLMMTYCNPESLCQKIRASLNPQRRIEDLSILMEFAAKDIVYRDLYATCQEELFRHIMEFQQQELSRNGQ
ncbi:MAG: hypothetical protein IJK50_05455 [Prevotella sp.]|nr:hypothetical protein [Prevotella sp.]